MKDIFISHNWGKDNLKRDNHKRCILLSEMLESKGYSTWLDKNDLLSNIDSAIIKGINNCKVVLICLTEKYMTKIDESSINNVLRDNCFKEWNYSLFKKKPLIPISMEPTVGNLLTNKDGIIQMYLYNTIFIDFSQNFEDEFNALCKTLKSYGILTENEKKFCKNQNSSFDKMFNSIFNRSFKNISPRSKLTILNKMLKKEKKWSIYNFFFKKSVVIKI